MDNTEKLIRAWLKCEGYEIEEIRGKPLDMHTEKGFLPGRWATDYKVTKKESPLVTMPSTKYDFGKSKLQ